MPINIEIAQAVTTLEQQMRRIERDAAVARNIVLKHWPQAQLLANKAAHIAGVAQEFRAIATSLTR